ncbi:ERCC4 domain-containing protein [Nonomuraea zeae]|uniref:ERCC4 domain-containing protein n=1 Tax=Nonomuraea zeae TaxID=1642303 RepID=A0A5S4FYP8_9ACTN|nr:histone-like nucleoid-structuring protein Lsr2 [Nonomuraea zeae]TMR25853.1 hypothetical protein ETD85_44530 [Nonomuraea zeae]
MTELVIVRNPDPEARLPYLIRLPLGPDELILQAGGTWPREKAICCRLSSLGDWPGEPEVVERVPVRSCVRRGPVIDLVLDRARENRSQLVFTAAEGADTVLWRAAPASGIPELRIAVSSGERYAYSFSRQQVGTVRRRLACGDYAVAAGGRVQAAVERESLPDLVAGLLDTGLADRLARLAALPHAAVVVEDRYAQVFEYAHPSVVADGIAELQVAFPMVPIVFCETRHLAEEWTYRFLAAAYAVADHERPPAEPTTAEIRQWAREHGYEVPDRGRLGRVVLTAYQHAHEDEPGAV